MTQEPFTLTSITDALGAIPALLGFTPDNSLVLIALAENPGGRRDVACTIRLNAEDTEVAARKYSPTIAEIRTATGSPITDIIAVAVTDADHTGAALRGIDAFRAELGHYDIAVVYAVHTCSLTAGSPFTDLDTGEAGVVPDTISHALAVLETTQGRVIGANRDELVARFAAGERIPESVALDAARTMGENFLPATFDELAAAIGSNEIPSENLTARVGLALGTGRLEVRDAFLALGFNGYAAAANTFTVVANRLRGVARAQALTVAAFFWYCTGNGAAVLVAVDAIRAAAYDAGIDAPTLATMLDNAIDGAVAPVVIQHIAADITPEYVAEHIGTVQSYT